MTYRLIQDNRLLDNSASLSYITRRYSLTTEAVRIIERAAGPVTIYNAIGARSITVVAN